jgi:hypothetical protein
MAQRSDAALAATAYQKVCALFRQEREEIESSPEQIKAKYEARRRKVLDALPEKVRKLTFGLLSAGTSAEDSGAEEDVEVTEVDAE